MVGVPGRSKACTTCKKRKIACDACRPICSQCVRSNRECGGYSSERKWINNSVMKLAVDPGKKSCGQDFSEIVETADLCTEPLPRGSNFNDRSISVFAFSLSSQIASAPSIRQQLVGALMADYTTATGPRSLKPWIASLCDLPSTTAVLDFSSTALALAALGRGNADTWAVNVSLRYYTNALRQLQKALWNPEQMFKDEVLAACMILGMYEVMECPGKNRKAYESHTHGIAKLIKLRGPAAHISGLGHQIFNAWRQQELFQALRERRESFVSESEWMTIPWTCWPKAPLQQLNDFLSYAPSIFCEADKLELQEPRARLRTTVKLINRCWHLDYQLGRFYEDLKETREGELYWPTVSTWSLLADECPEEKLFPIAYHFPDLFMASTMMMYWAIQTMLWGGMLQLYAAVNEAVVTPGGSDGTEIVWEDSAGMACDDTESCRSGSEESTRVRLPALGSGKTFMSAARNVCQSAEYCLQGSMMNFGAAMALGPLNIVVEHFREVPGLEREVLWIEQVLEQIYERGIRYVKYWKVE